MPSDSTSDETPRDRRPKPQFGELAPEGWVWEPPKNPHASDSEASGAAVSGTTPPPAPRTPQVHSAAPFTATPPAPGARTVPGWDRPVTLGLLVLGLFGTFLAISILNTLPQAIQTLYTQEGLGAYVAAENVDGILLAGAIVQALLWATTAAIAVRLLSRGHRGFYVPLIGGVVSLVVIFGFMSVVLSGDPTLLNSIAGTPR